MNEISTKHEIQRTVLRTVLINKEFVNYSADFSAMKMRRRLLFAEDHILQSLLPVMKPQCRYVTFLIH